MNMRGDSDVARVMPAVHAAITEVNAQLAPESRIALRGDAPIVSSQHKLDSLMVLTLLTETEAQLAKLSTASVTLTDEHTLTHLDEVLCTVSSFANYVARRLQQAV